MHVCMHAGTCTSLLFVAYALSYFYADGAAGLEDAV